MSEFAIEIHVVRSPNDAEAVCELVWEFFDYLRRDFPDRAAMIEKYLEVQDVAGELAELLQRFVPPRGECILARLDGAPIGTLMLKSVNEDTCEMNRMSVRPTARGRGVGRALIDGLCDRAREMGFSIMKLEALDERIPAVPLYHKMGFVTDTERSAYTQHDTRIIAMKKTL